MDIILQYQVSHRQKDNRSTNSIILSLSKLGAKTMASTYIYSIGPTSPNHLIEQPRKPHLMWHQDFLCPQYPLIEGRMSATLIHQTKFFISGQKYSAKLMHTTSTKNQSVT